MSVGGPGEAPILDQIMVPIPPHPWAAKAGGAHAMFLRLEERSPSSAIPRVLTLTSPFATP